MTGIYKRIVMNQKTGGATEALYDGVKCEIVKGNEDEKCPFVLVNPAVKRSSLCTGYILVRKDCLQPVR